MKIVTAHKTISIPTAALEKGLQDPVKSAEAVHLVYISEKAHGIKRIKKGKSFAYIRNGKSVKDTATLSRIKALAIPPAWKSVWICRQSNGHLQCTGIDAMGRKQYRYHPLWNALRSETKFYRILQFGKALKRLRKKINAELRKKDFSKQKVLAATVAIMDKTGLRIGNQFYEKLYGSFGLSTLKNRHIKISGNIVTFSFKGKKGIYQEVALKSIQLAKIIATCKEIPGKELFQYIDANGKRHAINSEDVNHYIKEMSGNTFTSKDFRTWVGSVKCLMALIKVGPFENQKQRDSNMVDALDQVARTLGNTRAVTKKHYVHPAVLSLYENGRLFEQINGNTSAYLDTDAKAESFLLEILKKETIP